MRLIDAQSFNKDLMEEASFRTRKAYDDSSVAEARGLIRACDLLKQQPTVDAISVVRCGECRHSTPHSTDNTSIFCLRGMNRHLRMKKDDYCSHGERKDGEKCEK